MKSKEPLPRPGVVPASSEAQPKVGPTGNAKNSTAGGCPGCGSLGQVTALLGIGACTESNISLCMVVKNEAEYLENCLKHISPWVRELIVVDTGSSDATPTIAKHCGAACSSSTGTTIFLPLEFLSTAANEAWILVLDADERFALREAERLSSIVQSASAPAAYSFLQKLSEGSGQIAWTRVGKPTHTSMKRPGYAGYIDIAVARLFPRHPQVGFTGCVHESVEGALAASGIPLVQSGLVLHHYGQVRDSAECARKCTCT